MFISFDDGGRWQSFQQNLPVTPVTDIKVHRQDLVLSTMGRSFWIMDDITPLHQLAAAEATGRETSTARGAGSSAFAEAAADKSDPATNLLFQPRPAYRVRYVAMGNTPTEPQYPPPGAFIDYYFPSKPDGEVKLEIATAAGKLVQGFTIEKGAESSPSTATTMRGRETVFPSARLSNEPGMHRFSWDLRYPGPLTASGRHGAGPLVAPGKYQAKLSAGAWSEIRTFEVKIDPRVAADGVTQAHLQEQLDFNLKLIATMNDARQLANALAAAAKEKGSSDDAKPLREAHARFVTAGGAYPQPMLIDQLANIYRMTNAADQRIGRDAIARYDDLLKEFAALKAEVARLGIK
jgi:hypothetical protein